MNGQAESCHGQHLLIRTKGQSQPSLSGTTLAIQAIPIHTRKNRASILLRNLSAGSSVRQHRPINPPISTPHSTTPHEDKFRPRRSLATVALARHPNTRIHPIPERSPRRIRRGCAVTHAIRVHECADRHPSQLITTPAPPPRRRRDHVIVGSVNNSIVVVRARVYMLPTEYFHTYIPLLPSS